MRELITFTTQPQRGQMIIDMAKYQIQPPKGCHGFYSYDTPSGFVYKFIKYPQSCHAFGVFFCLPPTADGGLPPP